MPIYSFQCTTPGCERVFDSIVHVDQEEATCPGCGKLGKRTFVQGKNGISFRFNYLVED